MSRGRAKSDRSRRCLLLAGLAFLALQLGVGLILDRSLPKIRFSDAETVISAAARLSRSPDIMFMGSSRFRGGLNMGELQEFMSTSFGVDAPLMFNAALPAGDPFAMDYLIRLLARQGITPGMVIIELSPETVKPWCPWMDIQIVRLITWQDIPDALQDFIASRRISHLLSSRIIPVFLYRKELLTWIFGSPPPYLKAASVAAADVYKGPTPEPAEESIKSRPVPPGIAKFFRNYQIGGINAQHLEAMLTYLHQRNVPVILVGFPGCRYYLDCCTPEINGKFMDYIEYLRCAYGCSFVDCRNRVPNKFFKDDLHLGPAGAVLFTHMLESEVLHDAWMNFRRSQKNESSGVEGDGK
ncbi:MAG: hypothetical protein ACLP2X_16655 [Syntrophobacteraceae bacterium]